MTEPVADVIPGTTPELPDWYPAWAQRFCDLYFSGNACFFILHGNVHDLIPCRDEQSVRFLNLSSFLG